MLRGMADVVLAILVVGALLALWRGPLWRGRSLSGVTRPHPLRIGHRGVIGPVPENSLAAFRLAFEAPLDGIETDVQRTRDGVLVLVHDDVVAGVRVCDTTFEALTAHVPHLIRLDDLLDLAERYPGTLINLELKTQRLRSWRLAWATARAIRVRGLAGRVIVSSFNPAALAWFRLAAPELRTAYLWTGGAGVPRPLRTPWPAGWLHVDALHPHASAVDTELLALASARGLLVNVWTVNDVALARQLRDLGANGIVGDDPHVLLVATSGGPS
ncbi:glycerophosphodiester phosphodiesterase [soil metagenome]